jgi:hypothetical protein
MRVSIESAPTSSGQPGSIAGFQLMRVVLFYVAQSKLRI